MQFLRPSQDAPDASVSSVCIQGDQDTGRMGRRVLAGWAWRLGSGGKSLWKPGLPAGLGGISQHLFTCPASQKSPDPTWGSQWLWAHDRYMQTGLMDP